MMFLPSSGILILVELVRGNNGGKGNESYLYRSNISTIIDEFDRIGDISFSLDTHLKERWWRENDINEKESILTLGGSMKLLPL